MTRLLVVAPHLRVGGAQRLFAIQLPGLAARGFEVSVVLLEAEGTFVPGLRAAGIDVRCAAMRRRFDVPALRRVFAMAGRPDVVLTQDVRAHAVGRLVARRRGAKHVVLDHRGPELGYAPHREVVVRAMAPGVDAVLTSTPRKIDGMRRRGYPEGRIRVVPNGIDPLVPSAPRDELRARLGLRDDEVAVLNISVLRPEKRVDAFAAAVARARTDEPSVHGLVAGDGPERPAVEAAGRDAVTLLGHRDDIADVVAASDVVCLASGAEASPLALLEAMSLGLPVIAPDVGGVSEIVLDGRTGVLVAPLDDAALARAIVALARDPARRRELGETGRRRQRELFAADTMNDGYAAVLHEVAEA